MLSRLLDCASFLCQSSVFQTNFFRIYFHYFWLCVYYVNSDVYRNQKRVQNLLGLELEVVVSHLTCVLEIELKPPARAVPTPNCWALTGACFIPALEHFLICRLPLSLFPILLIPKPSSNGSQGFEFILCGILSLRKAYTQEHSCCTCTEHSTNHVYLNIFLLNVLNSQSS